MPKLIDADGLFDATLSVFAERGYDGMTTREIAERAGVNEATIFRRHGTKAALVNAALTRALSATPFATLDIGQDVAVDLRNLVDAFAATTRALGGAVATLLVEAGRHPELRASTAPLLTNMGGAVRVLQAYQDRGALRREDPWQQLTRPSRTVRGVWTVGQIGHHATGGALSRHRHRGIPRRSPSLRAGRPLLASSAQPGVAGPCSSART